MPDEVQGDDFGFTQGGEAKLDQEPIENASVEGIELRPRQFPGADAVHGRGVAGPPGIGKLRGIHPEVLATRQILDVPDYGAAPVDDGAEDIEDEGFD